MAHVQGSVYVLMGDGGNITVQVGKDGVAMVDTGFAPLAEKAMGEIRKLYDGPVRWIVITHVHADHTGGNRPNCEARHDARIQWRRRGSWRNPTF